MGSEDDRDDVIMAALLTEEGKRKLGEAFSDELWRRRDAQGELRRRRGERMGESIVKVFRVSRDRDSVVRGGGSVVTVRRDARGAWRMKNELGSRTLEGEGALPGPRQAALLWCENNWDNDDATTFALFISNSDTDRIHEYAITASVPAPEFDIEDV